MAINKVIYGEETLVDLTNDTVTPESLEEGYTAHAANGEIIVGTAIPVVVHNIDPEAHPDIREQLGEILSLLEIDYNELTFNTNEIVVKIGTSPVLGQGILGQLILA